MSYFPFIFFIIAFLSVLFGAHFFVFRFFFGAFALSGVLWRYAAIALSFLLPSWFFLASFIAHAYENVFTRTLYLLAGVWLGVFVNLLSAALVVWLILIVSRFFGARLNARVIAGVALVFVVVVSGVGIRTAFHPVVKRVSVTIPDLPEEWRGKTIVHLSDVHLGHIYRADFLRGVVGQVNDLRPEAVMITGDFFDGMDGDLQSVSEPLGSLRSTYGTFFVTGNHETYLGVDQVFSALEGNRIRVLRDEVVDIGGIEIIGVSYPERGERKDVLALLSIIRAESEGRPSILLYHAPTAIHEIAQSGISLQLSGHTHRGQQFPFQLVTYLVHKGYDYGLYRIGGYSLYVSSGVGTWGSPIRIGTQSEIVAITLQ